MNAPTGKLASGLPRSVKVVNLFLPAKTSTGKVVRALPCSHNDFSLPRREKTVAGSAAIAFSDKLSNSKFGVSANTFAGSAVSWGFSRKVSVCIRVMPENAFAVKLRMFLFRNSIRVIARRWAAVTAAQPAAPDCARISSRTCASAIADAGQRNAAHHAAVCAGAGDGFRGNLQLIGRAVGQAADDVVHARFAASATRFGGSLEPAGFQRNR